MSAIFLESQAQSLPSDSMVDSVICEDLLHVATLDSVGEECPSDRVKMFSEREVTMNEKHPYALGPRFDIYAARILLKDEEVRFRDTSFHMSLSVGLGKRSPCEDTALLDGKQ